MRRIRIVVLLLAVALGLPTMLLVHRTLQGVAAEKEARHRAVAERVFDEMERALSDFLRAEEERPASQYRFEPGSPLLAPAEPSFVVGHFEIGAGSQIRTPPDRAARVRPVVARYLEERAERGALAEADARLRQTPGTTLSRQRPRPAPGFLASRSRAAMREGVGRLEAGDADAKADRAYDVLQSLNLGAREREARRRKVVEEEAGSGLASSLEDTGGRTFAGSPALEAEVREPAALEAEESVRLRPSEGAADAAARSPSALAPAPRRELAAGRTRADAAPAEPPPAGAARQQLVIDPLTGRGVDAEHLLLSRGVWSGEGGTRQGLVLERAALAGWLRGRVFDPLGLPGASLDFGDDPGAAGGGSGDFRYRHRFAEPFQDLGAELALAPLAAVPGEGTVWALALLLAGVGAAGLFAIHRTAAVTVGFAERRSNFVAAVTHELKTPLTAIRMYGEMLRDGIVPDEDKRQEYYRTITAESERLSRLINNVLEFSRLERGTREMQLVSGDLGGLVEEMVELVRPHAEARGFRLELQVEAGLPPVLYERDALLQVLFNLVDNAVKYASDADDRRIRIACTADAEEGVVLRVRDHGPGIPRRHLGRVFEPFYRGEDELTRRTQGTGLGLALVRGLAERMDAAVSATTPADGGLEIRIAFAAADGDVP